MMPLTIRTPPSKREALHVLALPSPRPPTMIDAAAPPPPAPPSPPPPPTAGAVPLAPQPFGYRFSTIARLRSFTVSTLTCLSTLYRLPL